MDQILFSSFLILLFAYPLAIFICIIKTRHDKEKFKCIQFKIDRVFLKLLIFEIVLVAIWVSQKEVSTFIIIMGIALIAVYLDHLHERRK